MTFNEWWKNFKKGTPVAANVASMESVAKAAWYAAIDQAVYQQQKNQDNRAEHTTIPPLTESTVRKGGVNTPLKLTNRPPKPGGSGIR